MEDWPFDEPKNLAVITLRQIMHSDSPILHVTHDADDGGWQFLSEGPPREADATVVALHRVVARDPSVAELADLPIGWHAWRENVETPWIREPEPLAD
jgi:hypothetical protein